MARRCGAKHICESKCTKHLRSRAIFALRISKHGTPLRRESHLQVKIYKPPEVRSNFWSSDLENGTPLWREAHLQVKMRNMPHSRSNFWSFDLECRLCLFWPVDSCVLSYTWSPWRLRLSHKKLVRRVPHAATKSALLRSLVSQVSLCQFVSWAISSKKLIK